MEPNIETDSLSAMTTMDFEVLSPKSWLVVQNQISQVNAHRKYLVILRYSESHLCTCLQKVVYL